jgi:hypothetical protein
VRGGMDETEKKCTVKGCKSLGIPAEGFDFFVCDRCLEVFECYLEQEAMKRIIQNN